MKFGDTTSAFNVINKFIKYLVDIFIATTKKYVKTAREY